MNHKRRHTNRGQYIPNVGIHRHRQQFHDSTRTYCTSLKPSPRTPKFLILRFARGEPCGSEACFPLSLAACEEPVRLLLADTPWIICGNQKSSGRVAQHKSRCSCWVRCSKQRAHRTALRDSKQKGTRGIRGINSARRSSIRSSNVGSRSTESERPVPRRSMKMSLEKLASRSRKGAKVAPPKHTRYVKPNRVRKRGLLGHPLLPGKLC
jgi:hypothetical protein